MKKFNYNIINENDKTFCSGKIDPSINETVVKNLVKSGIPTAFSPSNFINKIAHENNISTNEARLCLKSAIKILEKEKTSKISSNVSQRPDEKLNAQSGYFYPQKNNEQSLNGEPKNSMDNLNSFGYYNKVMFGLG